MVMVPRMLLISKWSRWKCLPLYAACQCRPLHVGDNLAAGHSKWANIRHIKAEKDSQKATMINKLSRQIRLAIQEGGADPQLNSTLKNTIEMALRNNMPLATIENNIKRCQQSKQNLKRYTLELRNKQIFYMCVLYTDNLAQVKMEMAPVVRKAGVTFVDAAYLFDNFGFIETTRTSNGTVNLEDLVTEDAINCGAEDVEIVNAEEGKINFICSPINLNAVCKMIEAKGYAINHADSIYTAKQTILLKPTEEIAIIHNNFVNKLRDITGIDEVYDNVKIADL